MHRFSPEDAPALVRAARRAAGVTQSELAAAVGLNQPNLANIEAGRRSVSPELLERILKTAGYRPSAALAAIRGQVVALAADYGLSNVRVFGSVAGGEDDFDSDIDLLVDAKPGTSTFEIGAFAEDVELLTGFPVDVLVDRPGREFTDRMRDRAVAV